MNKIALVLRIHFNAISKNIVHQRYFNFFLSSHVAKMSTIRRAVDSNGYRVTGLIARGAPEIFP